MILAKAMPVIVSTVLMCGCLTSELVVWNAREREKFATISEVERAGQSDDTIFVELSVLLYGDEATEPFLLSIDKNGTVGPLTSKRETPEYYESVEAGIVLIHPRAEVLHRFGRLPEDSTSIPIRRVHLDDLDKLGAVIDDSDAPVQIYAITYEPDPDAWEFRDPIPGWNRPESRQLLVVQYEPRPSHPVAIMDFYEGSYRQWGWYALTPLTVAGDIITFPLQLLLVIIIGH